MIPSLSPIPASRPVTYPQKASVPDHVVWEGRFRHFDTCLKPALSVCGKIPRGVFWLVKDLRFAYCMHAVPVLQADFWVGEGDGAEAIWMLDRE